jgi:hypothetical protein
MKPLLRKLQVWFALHMQGHNPRRDMLFLFIGIMCLIGLSEVVLDGLFARVPSREHMPTSFFNPNNADFETKQDWLTKCVARVPRLIRPRFAPAYRMHLLNRHLFCLAASPMLTDKGLMLEANDGAGGAGFAMFLGARMHPGRQVVVVHETNEQNLFNFGPEDQKVIGLTRDLDPLDALEKACERGAELLSVGGGEPLADFAVATTALQCKTTKFVVLTGVDEAELERVRKEYLEDWKELVVSVDYLYYSPIAAPFCFFRIPLFCTRVPFVVLTRIK